MVNSLDIARYFILRAYEDGREAYMTNMKVQKLLYYVQSLHLALYNEPLFAEEIQAWRYGPVCPPAYQLYSKFEAEQLPVPRWDELTGFSEEIQSLLEEVWENFGAYHAYLLSDMTHQEFPWKKARKDLPPSAASQEKILLSDMQVLGQQKLAEIERSNPAYEKIIPFVLEAAFSENTPKTYIKQGEVHDWLTSFLP